MLLFNLPRSMQETENTVISKHHMLLFNCSVMCILSLSDSFQNIICYCLTSNIPIPCVTISSFQNIICYCLTDAVNAETIRVRRFQNIICYCLTIKVTVEDKKAIAFQNIICYCLTHYDLISCHHNYISKHHMLLFNFLLIHQVYHILRHFKTSYVIV